MAKIDRFTPDLRTAREAQENAPWASRRKELDRRVTDARTFLLMRHHFFGRLVMRMKYVWTEEIPTMAVTADMVIYMNPDFTERLNVGELAFLVAHEVSHVCYLHFERIGNRNPTLWNHAGDYMINAMLVKAGLPMPVLDDRWNDHPNIDQMREVAKKAGHNCMGLLDKKYADMSDVQIYELLWEEMKQQMQQGACCPECGQQTQQQGGQSQQDQPGQSGQQQGGSQQGQQQQAGGQQGQQQSGQQQGQGGSGAGDDQQQGGQDGQEQDGQGQGGQTQKKGKKGQKKGQGAGQGDEQDQAQGGQGQGEGQDGQHQSQQGQAGGNVPSQQQPQGGGHTKGSGSCKTCGQQKPQQGGWGTELGDADFGATEQLKRDMKEGRGEKVLTPGQIRDLLITAASQTKALGRGTVPGAFERFIEELRDPQLPWNHLLERWVSSVLVSGQSYRRPARSSATLVRAAQVRGMASGVRPIMPGPKPDLQPVVITVDVSGSRDEKDLRDDLSEVFAVLERYHNPVRVIVWDAEVQFDEYVKSVDEVNLKGGGGTATEPMFDAIAEDPGHWGPPAAVITFTDGLASYPDEPPPYPVLWVWTGKGDIPMTPPFGEVITLEQHGMLAAFATSHERALGMIETGAEPDPVQPRRGRTR